MTVKKAKAKTKVKAEAPEIKMEKIVCHIIGDSPFIMMDRFIREKVIMHHNLQPKPPCDPLKDFRKGLYRNKDKTQPTLLYVPGHSFVQAMANVGLRMPGTNKSDVVWRLINVTDVNLYGIPQMSLFRIWHASDYK